MKYVVGLVLASVVLVGCAGVTADSGTPFAQVSSSQSQPAANEPTQVIIDTVEAAQGIWVQDNALHVPYFGCYFTMFAPQVGSNVGETADFQAWMRVNEEDVPNSNVLLRLTDETKDVIVSQGVICMQAGDKVTFWIQGDKSGVGIEAIDTSPNPIVPAHISTMYKVD
jgi:hypothetical protein